MADYTAKWRIQGENGTQAAFRSMLGDAKSTADRMSGLFRAAFAGISITSLVALTKNAAAFGDEMQKAALRTGMGAGEFATLASAAKLADVELGTLSKGLRALMVAQSEAATGSKEAKQSFAALGIQLDQFRRLDARQQLEEIADRLRQIESPADRARIGSNLFGRAWEEMGPFLLQGADAIRKATDEVERLQGTLSDEEIQRLADTDQAIKELTLSFTSLSRTLIAEVSPSLSQFLRNVNAIVTSDAIGKIEEQIDFLRRMQGRSFVAAGYGDIGSGFFTAEAGAAKLRELEAKLAEMQREPGSGLPPGGRNRRPFVPGLMPEEDKPKPKKAASSGGGFEMSEDTKEWLNAREDRFRRAQDALDLHKDIEAQLARDLDETSNVLGRQIEDNLDRAIEMAEQVSPFAEQAARNVQDAFAAFLFDPFAEGLDGMIKSFADTLRQMAAQAAASELLKVFFSWAGGLGGGAGQFFTSMGSAIGARAIGGPVTGGMPYLVGERGPELFVPGMSGGIVPSHALAGGAVAVNVVNNYDMRGATQDVVKMLPAILERNRQQTIAETQARLRDNFKRRGRL